MEVDGCLVYKPANWRETLASFRPLEHNDHRLEMEPFPEEKVLAALAKLIYSDCTSKELPQDWELVTTAYNNSYWVDNGYYGCAVWNRLQQQVVIVHRGVDDLKHKSVFNAINSALVNQYTGLINSAITFVDDIKEAILKKNKQAFCRFVLSISGHSLGAWVAGVTTLTVKYLKKEGSGFCRVASPEEGLHAHTLMIDGPGVEDTLVMICRDYGERNKYTWLEQLDITNIFAAVNVVNCTNFHIGNLYQLHVKREESSRKPSMYTNMSKHSINIFIKAFDEGWKKNVVHKWPRGKIERHRIHSKEIVSDSHILDDSPSSSIPYNSEPWKGNFCQLRVFSEEEQKFLENWSSFQNNAFIKLTEIKKFQSHHRLEKITLPKFSVDNKKNTITCETGDDLRKVIRLTKNLFRWFPAELTDAVGKQKERIKGAPLYLAGERYLRSLPEILDCEDTLGVATFLLSQEQQVVQIEASDLNFEAARIKKILIRIKNTDLDKLYLKKSCHTFIDSNDMSNDLDVGYLNDYVTNDNLLILKFTTPTEYYDPKYDLLGKILRNFERCRHKKLIIILEKAIIPEFFIFYNLRIDTKPLKLFDLSDLTLPRDEILASGTIALGDKTVNLNTFFGIAFKSHDKDYQRKMNTFISPIVVKLVKKNKNLCVAKIKHKF